MSSNSVFLDIDSSILEQNLLITANSDEQQMQNVFPTLANNQSKLIRPTPGFCLKARDPSTNRKIFLNICRTHAIPPPRDITAAELVQLLEDTPEDEPPDYRIPMSIGELKSESDKKEQPSHVCDVAINDKFCEKVLQEKIFQEFLVAVAFEGFSQKYNIKVGDERVMLKNKKVLGTLQEHRIRQRERDNVEPEELKFQMPSTSNENRNGKTLIEVLESSNEKEDVSEPKYRLFQKINDLQNFYAEIYLPYVRNNKDINLHLSEDRIVLETEPKKYFLDIFHEFKVNQAKASSDFNKSSKFLTITMPIVIS